VRTKVKNSIQSRPIATCFRCNLHAETFVHYVCYCNYSTNNWSHFRFNYLDFFSDMIDHDWLKNGWMGPCRFLFVAALWWSWRHRNNMLFSNETWYIHHLSFNIQSMVQNFKACFKPTSNVTLESRFMKWNNKNIFNGSCLDSHVRVGFSCVFTIILVFTYQDFQVIITLHRIFSKENYLQGPLVRYIDEH